MTQALSNHFSRTSCNKAVIGTLGVDATHSTPARGSFSSANPPKYHGNEISIFNLLCWLFRHRKNMEHRHTRDNGSLRRAHAQMIARLREINPDQVMRYVSHYMEQFLVRGVKISRFSFPQVAGWLRMSLHDLESLIFSTKVLGYSTDARGVRWIPSSHLITFMRHLKEMKRLPTT